MVFHIIYTVCLEFGFHLRTYQAVFLFAPLHKRQKRVKVSAGESEMKDKKWRREEVCKLQMRLRKVHSKYQQDLVEERKKRGEKEDEIWELKKEIWNYWQGS